MFLSISFKKGADDRSGHTGEWHDIDNTTRTPLCKIDRLPNRKDGLSFEGGVQVRFGLFKNGFGFGFAKVSELPFKYLLQLMLILLLVIVR